MAYHIKFTIMRKLSIFEPPVFVSLMEQHTKKDGIRYHSFASDVDLLLNQKRLDGFDKTSIEKYFTPTERNTQLDKFSDEELMLSIKSRRIQTPDQLKKWTEFLETQKDDIKDFVKHNSKKSTKNSDKSDSTSNNEQV